MMGTVSFPGLGGLEIPVKQIAFTVFGWPVHWYGIIIAAGFLLAVLYCTRKADSFGIKQDDLIDMLFFAVPLSIVGARLYYIIFYLDLYKNADGTLNFGQMVRIWDGGLAIYGAVILAAVTLLIFCKVRKIKFLAFADLGVFGLLIGQCIGRWGNFVNIEAYGGPTTLPWRMGIYESVNGALQYVEVHPTFLYESLWNLVGFLLLVLIAKKWRKFDGQIFLGYLAWYGIGRGVIEGLRTDSLYFFNTPIRVSQLLGFATGAVALVILIYLLAARKHDPANLLVEQLRIQNIQRVALVYPEGDPEALVWAQAQKERIAKAGGYTEEYALPAATSGEARAELVATLEAREDLDEVLRPE